MIYLPYLSTWNQASSSPAELMGCVASAFSQSPPVYAKQAAATPAQPPAAVARATATPASGYSQPPVAVAKAVPVVQTAVAKAVTLSPREQAVRNLTEKAKERWGGVVEPIIADINEQGKRKADLQNAAEKVTEAVAALERETKENQLKEAELVAIEAQLRPFVEAHAGVEPDP